MVTAEAEATDRLTTTEDVGTRERSGSVDLVRYFKFCGDRKAIQDTLCNVWKGLRDRYESFCLDLSRYGELEKRNIIFVRMEENVCLRKKGKE